MGPIYQKKAVERLESPDQLDRMIFVTSPMTWMLIAGFAVILSAFLAWTFLGTIRQSITVNGMVTENVSLLAYVPLDEIQELKEDNRCLIRVTAGEHAGVELDGKVAQIDHQIVSREMMEHTLQNDGLVTYFWQEEPVCGIMVSLEEEMVLEQGELLEMQVIVSEMSPYEFAFSNQQR
ncbi:MAG: hypothetical protein IKV59_03265 [Lachnospiraceae bacterium]|nr:hypothetical protein [Lachnospiraceae bacterium]